MNKYFARRTERDGIKFDSEAEAARYCQLRLLERAGHITELRRQVPFELVPAEKDMNGKKLRALVYRADFVYRDNYGALHVEDVKGVRTAVYKLKKRLMWHIHGIEIEET